MSANVWKRTLRVLSLFVCSLPWFQRLHEKSGLQARADRGRMIMVLRGSQLSLRAASIRQNSRFIDPTTSIWRHRPCWCQHLSQLSGPAFGGCKACKLRRSRMLHAFCNDPYDISGTCGWLHCLPTRQFRPLARASILEGFKFHSTHMQLRAVRGGLINFCHLGKAFMTARNGAAARSLCCGIAFVLLSSRTSSFRFDSSLPSATLMLTMRL